MLSLLVGSLDLRSVQGHLAEGKLDVIHAEVVGVHIVRNDSNDCADGVLVFR